MKLLEFTVVLGYVAANASSSNPQYIQNTNIGQLIETLRKHGIPVDPKLSGKKVLRKIGEENKPFVVSLSYNPTGSSVKEYVLRAKT